MNTEKYKPHEPLFGNWHIKEALGAGNYGTVFEITRQDFDETYKAALKAITIPQTPGEVESIRADGMDEGSVTAYFRQMVKEVVGEIVLMSKLKGNSNIVSYEDHTVIPHADGLGWDILIRMELLTPLIRHIRNTPITQNEVVKLGIHICRALELCQKHSIIHRDIKPENIFISENGEYKLGDFGISRTIEKTTGVLSQRGTFTYMAPEVFSGKPYGSCVDIYSLGVVMYWLLNENRAPFLPAYPQPIAPRDREMAFIRRIGGEDIPPPSQADVRLGEIVLKMCAYDQLKRYDSLALLRADLETILHTDDTATSVETKPDEAEAHLKRNDYMQAGVVAPHNEAKQPAFTHKNEKTVALSSLFDSRSETGTVNIMPHVADTPHEEPTNPPHEGPTSPSRMEMIAMARQLAELAEAGTPQEDVVAFAQELAAMAKGVTPHAKATQDGKPILDNGSKPEHKPGYGYHAPVPQNASHKYAVMDDTRISSRLTLAMKVLSIIITCAFGLATYFMVYEAMWYDGYPLITIAGMLLGVLLLCSSLKFIHKTIIGMAFYLLSISVLLGFSIFVFEARVFSPIFFVPWPLITLIFPIYIGTANVASIRTRFPVVLGASIALMLLLLYFSFVSFVVIVENWWAFDANDIIHVFSLLGIGLFLIWMILWFIKQGIYSRTNPK